MKTTFALRLILGAAFALASFGLAAHADTLDDIRKAGKIRIAIDLAIPPFGMTDDKMQPTGSDVDLARLLAQVGDMAKVERQWDADVLRFSAQVLGQGITGTIAVAERDVRVEVAIPGVLGMIAQRLKGRLVRETQVLLAPPKP